MLPQHIFTPKIPIIGICENTPRISIIGSLGSIDPSARATGGCFQYGGSRREWLF